jgi:hypothetical protein
MDKIVSGIYNTSSSRYQKLNKNCKILIKNLLEVSPSRR